jgi:hypothetical protein
MTRVFSNLARGIRDKTGSEQGKRERSLDTSFVITRRKTADDGEEAINGAMDHRGGSYETTILGR